MLLLLLLLLMVLLLLQLLLVLLLLLLQLLLQHLHLLLRDNGPGFSPESLARAREPFFTTKTSAQGLGLGLAICDSLVRALDGELLLANHPAGGALITLRLRLTSPGVNLQPSEDPSP